MKMGKGHNLLFPEGWSVIAKLLKSSSYLNFVNIVKMVPKWCWRQKVLMKILVGQRTRPDHNMTIYDKTKFSSCHIPYINSILHPASSYYFLSHKNLFQAGNFNVNVRPDLLYFRLWGVLKNIPKHNLWPTKTAKTLCTSSRRLVWWNVIHSTKISVVLLALKAKGQKILNAPRILLVSDWSSVPQSDGDFAVYSGFLFLAALN